jgi:integrase
MRWTDVDFELARVYVRRSAPTGFDTIKASKNNRQRWVDLTPELAAAFRAIRHGAELVFCRDDGSMMRPGQFHEVLWAAQKRAGLRRIKWHDLRHRYASILASGEMPLFLIRGLLGHSSEDGGALRESRGVANSRVHAVALYRSAVRPRVSQGLPSPRPSPASGRGRYRPFSWALGGPGHPRLA